MKKLNTFVNTKIVFRSGGEVLVFRANDGHHYLPGGHLEYGEHSLDALQRELREEMAYELPAEPVALGAWTHVSSEDESHRITIAYLLDLPTKPDFQWIVPQSTEGFEEFVWVQPDQIDKIAINQGFRRLLRRAVDHAPTS